MDEKWSIRSSPRASITFRACIFLSSPHPSPPHPYIVELIVKSGHEFVQRPPGKKENSFYYISSPSQVTRQLVQFQRFFIHINPFFIISSNQDYDTLLFIFSSKQLSIRATCKHEEICETSDLSWPPSKLYILFISPLSGAIYLSCATSPRTCSSNTRSQHVANERSPICTPIYIYIVIPKNVSCKTYQSTGPRETRLNFFKVVLPVWWPSWQPWKPKRPMSTQDPSGSPRKWSYVFCALPDRRTPNSSRCNDRFHDPSRCPICLRWIAPTSVAARYLDVVVVVDDPPFDRYCDTVNRRRIVADSPIPIRTAVVGAARCSIVDPSSGQGSGGHDDRPRAR